MNDRTVTVFGGTGFLGRRIVRHLRTYGFCVRTASRHPSRTGSCLVAMIRSFNLSRPIFMKSDQLPMQLPAPTVWSMRLVSISSAPMTHLIPSTLRPPNASQRKPT